MYVSSSGETYAVIDTHIHYWDASPENQANRYGAGFIECFYNMSSYLSPPEEVWPYEDFLKYPAERLGADLFERGYVDIAITQPTYLSDFFINGFNTTERNAELKERWPDRIIVNGQWDPRDGEAGLQRLERLAKRYALKAIKLYTAEWRGDSRGYRLDEPATREYLAACRDLGITNIHVHKGPTIWPLDADAFDVRDVDKAATDFPDLNFIVEHVGLPRLEDFCWIAVQEPNVYAGLAAAMPFINKRPRYFGEIIGELIFSLGPDRLLFGSDYPLWLPHWLIERFVDYQLPPDLAEEFGFQLDADLKRKILAENAARLYGIDLDARVPTGAGVAAAGS